MNFSPHPWGISWGIYPISAPLGEDAVAKILTLVTKLSRKDCCLKLELNFNRDQGENGHQGGCPFAEMLGDPVNPLNLFSLPKQWYSPCRNTAHRIVASGTQSLKKLNKSNITVRSLCPESKTTLQPTANPREKENPIFPVTLVISYTGALAEHSWG